MFSVAAKIAWASLARRRVRSLMVVMMIAVSLWGLLFMEGIYDGMTEQMIRNTIRADCGHLSLFARGYRLDPDLHKQIRNSTAVEAVLHADKQVLSYVKRIQQDGLVATAHAARGATVYGIKLEDENRQFGLLSYVISPADSLTPGDETGSALQKNATLIGYKLAEKCEGGQ